MVVGTGWGADWEFAGDCEPAAGAGGDEAPPSVCELAGNRVVRKKKISTGTLFRRRIITRLGINP